ncbi:hypothetical protein M231_01180 [Tremella mesenterica]|uniref:Uncharacterized protein n=1 Tax=Tremella mesenterica TaxID=5217 RepID=A0A4Q1BU27_TREME|nr:hypothetical protein M231_01180 [Tremella mesenterica]
MGRGAMAHNHKFPLILPPPGGLNAARYSEIVLPKLKEYEEILSAEIDQMVLVDEDKVAPESHKATTWAPLTLIFVFGCLALVMGIVMKCPSLYTHGSATKEQ